MNISQMENFGCKYVHKKRKKEKRISKAEKQEIVLLNMYSGIKEITFL